MKELKKELEKLERLIRIHNDNYHFSLVPGPQRNKYFSEEGVK